MAKKKVSSQKKGLKDIPLIGKIGLLALFGFGAYKLITHKPPPKKFKCPDTLNDSQKELIKRAASKLRIAMDTTVVPSFTASDRSRAWDVIPIFAAYDNMLCFMHNYWLSDIDKTTSLYDWIDSEVTIPTSTESNSQSAALTSLQVAGLGNL